MRTNRKVHAPRGRNFAVRTLSSGLMIDSALERLAGVTIDDKVVAAALDRAEAEFHINQFASHFHDADLVVAVLVCRAAAIVFQSGRQKRCIRYGFVRG